MRRPLISVLLCTAAALAADGISLPRIGCFVEGGDLRALDGVAGVFVVETIAREAVSGACSGALTLVQLRRVVELRSRAGRLIATWPAPEEPVRFEFNRSGSECMLYFPGGERASASLEGFHWEGAGAPPDAEPGRQRLAGDWFYVRPEDGRPFIVRERDGRLEAYRIPEARR